MNDRLQSYQIAHFALDTTFERIGPENIDQLKRHLLDAIGSMLHAATRPTMRKMARQLHVLGTGGPCSAPLFDGLAADRAAQWLTALIRYPDFMDNFMGKEATCHPSDNIGPLLAMSQLHPTNGKELLTAMGIAYQLECRLVLEIPVMKEGIDHTLLLAYSMVASVSRLIGLNEEQMANAFGMAGTSISPMVTSRASYTSEWKGLASSLVALNIVNICFLAAQDVTGPVAVFEGPKGFEEVFKMKLKYDWDKENFDLIHKCVLKRFNAEVHSQAVLEGVLDIRRQLDFTAGEIESIDISTFLTAYHIIGGGAYGNRKDVRSKEQADHSLFYVVAVAMLDGQVYPEQLTPERIEQDDVQQLLQKISVHTGIPLHEPLVVAGLLDPYTQAYPDEMRTKIIVHLKDGRKLTVEKRDYHGFFTRPFSWNDTIEKFTRLTNGVIASDHQQRIIETVRNLDNLDSRALTDLLHIPAVD